MLSSSATDSRSVQGGIFPTIPPRPCQTLMYVCFVCSLLLPDTFKDFNHFQTPVLCLC
ncbi:hypothetical protein CPB83DRAFT_857401 [Crepidotus variabilis]|uniref:Uncharacterized protein n=1 Tax=Crepidotus variabilis TaxID=179855 RepID=A0A9P6ED24_9AGAR|nr:hypothetical protein CPB83DRAFT_857401 [Crepidotus variabilis]